VRRAVKASAAPERPKRRYDAPRRRAAAEATRRRILAAARAQFLARGYAAATMAAVAAAAGVSVETVYLAVGPKAALVRELVELALSGGDRPVPPPERAGVREIQAEPDPRRKVRLFARLVRALQERLAPIWAVVEAAAPGDPELAALVAELYARHVGSMRLFVDHLAAAGHLRPGLAPDLATDLLWAMNSPAFFRLLVGQRRWSGDTLERFLADAWQLLLLPDAAAPPAAADR
jgi:AcrR family transcriptional regulator